MVAPLHDILLAGSNLLQLESAAGQERNLKSVLNTRLENFYASLSKSRPLPAPVTIQDLHLETAQCALEVVEQAHRLLDVDAYPSMETLPSDGQLPGRMPDDAPVVGARDLTQLRTLLTMVFRWGVVPLFARISDTWTSKLPSRVGVRVVELAESPGDYESLSSLLMHLASILLPRGAHGHLSQTLITTSILDRHMVDFLRASMALGWLPKSLSSGSTRTVDDLRPIVLRLLEFMPLSQVIADLGTILSSVPPPSHVRRLCSSLLSKSLLRDKGINSLLAVIFGDEDTQEDTLLEKYEHVGQILKSIPAGMKPEAYFTAIVPGILRIVSEDVPPTHRRAASFSFTRMLDPEFPHKELVSNIALSIIHTPLTSSSTIYPQRMLTDFRENTDEPMQPSQALSTISTLLLNSDPSPTLVTLILSPILSSLYALMYHLDKTKASDPVLRDSVKALLITWGRIVECHEGVEQLWLLLHSERVNWQISESDEIVRTAAERPKLALLMQEDLRRQVESEPNDAFDLYPNAAHLVQYIKSLDRSDINSELFVRLLEVYYSSKCDAESDPMRMLLYLQTIMQMRAQLSGGSSPQSILSKPEHILQFVKQSLEPTTSPHTSMTAHSEPRRGLGLADLRIVPEDEDEFPPNDDSDDEEPPEMNGNGDEEMAETGINLLLATLGANPDLSARSAPILNDIFTLLEPFAACSLPSIRNLAREARMVMTARLASTSTAWPSPQAKGESAQEIYQKALKLLQDPILPVRAHGLLLLRQLVSNHSHSTESTLVPAILSIFMQSVQDDDSYIFLNAVQGLSAMVDAFGKEVLNGLLETYSRDLTSIHGGYLTKQEVDTRIRIGEALGQVIRRCGDTLGKYTDTVVPRLISVLHADQAPNVLRASAISLLTECIKTSFAALTWYTSELSSAMIDLLQVEMVSTVSTPSAHGGAKSTREETEDDGKKSTLDADIDVTPSSVDSRLPSLRRSALHFLTLLVQTLTQTVYDGSTVELPSAPFLRRTKTTLGYISSMDNDAITRVMAREAGEGIDQLMKAALGIE
ncbi:hypothetical protein J3A83DRAFT_4370121 [Scleroderma citrinum]